MLKTRRKIKVGPQDHGRRMSLDDFDEAEVAEGHLYELANGVIEVSNVPHFSHELILEELRDQLYQCKLANPGAIRVIGGGSGAKLLIAPTESERHPDLLVYLTAPPETETWSLWVPAIVVEVVSPSSEKRDYQDKPQEYLEFGVHEYWIVDPIKQQMTAHIRWRGQWRIKVIKLAQKYTTQLLKGFTLDLRKVLNAGK